MARVHPAHMKCGTGYRFTHNQNQHLRYFSPIHPIFLMRSKYANLCGKMSMRWNSGWNSWVFWTNVKVNWPKHIRFVPSVWKSLKKEIMMFESLNFNRNVNSTCNPTEIYNGESKNLRFGSRARKRFFFHRINYM